MPSPILTTDQYDIILSGGYRASEYVIVCPSTVIFQASIAATPASDVFAQVTYDTVTVGAYTDIKEGQVVLVSRTSDKRKAFFRGRVRQTPTSTILYINETSDAIQENDIIFVLDTYDIAEKLRKWPYVDWDLEFRKMPPSVKNMQSAYARLTTDTTAEFSFAPIGQALANGATISSYAWNIPDATYTVGDDETQDITIEVDTPYNEWGRLTITDSNGVSNWFAFTITAGDPNNPDHDFFRLCHEPVDYSADLENGYSATVSYWEGVEDLVDQTRVAIVVDEAYNGGDAELPNVRFVGYFTEDDGDVRGDERYGQLKNASINLSGFIQLAGELTFNAIIIAHDTTPADWDQIDTPTPVRCAAHVILEHSTLGNLAPIDWGVIDDSYFTGPTFDVPDGSVMDAANRIADRINASFTQDGGGQLVFRRNANFLTDEDRDDLETVTPDPITLGEGLSFTLKHTHRRRVRSVNVGYTVYSSVTGEKVTIAARAPANGSGPGPEEREIADQLLDPQTDLEDALDEARQRAGHWLEYLNPVDTLTVTLSDEFGFISPSNDQWYTFDIAASDLPRGVAISTTDRWLCISIAPKLNPNGSRNVQAVFRKETKGGAANIFVAIVPEETDTSLPVMPAYPSYGGNWSPSPSINYDTTDPATQQPFDANDMGQTLPLPAEQGASQGSGMAKPGCYVQSPPINFKNSSNVQTNFITTLGEDYTITVSGRARIQEENAPISYDFTLSDHGFTPLSGNAFAFGTQDSGGFKSGVTQLAIQKAGVTPDPVSVKYHFNEPISATINARNYGNTGPSFPTSISGVTEYTLAVSGLTDPLYIGVIFVPNTSSYRLTRIDLTYSTTGPAIYTDAFYQWEEDENGEPINVQLLSGKGLYLDNAAVSVPPPFSPNHEYTIPFTGTGNVLLSRFHDTDYTNNDNLILYLSICGPGAGS